MLPKKHPSESVLLEFDFSSELPQVTSAVVSITIEGDGIDPDVLTMISTPIQIKDTSVFQWITGGKTEVTYNLSCVGTYGSTSIVREDIMYVKD